MQCPNCGSENRDGANFCDECGFPLGGKIAQMAFPISERLSDADEESASAEDVQNGSTLASDGAEEPVVSGEAQDDVSEEGEAQQEGEEQETHDDGEAALPEQDMPEEHDHGDSSLPDLTMPLSSLEGEQTRSGIGGSGQIAGDSLSDSGGTRALDEDDFAGFTKSSDDGYSFGGPLKYDEGENPLGPGYTMKMPRVGDEPKEQSRDFRASSTVPKKSHGKVIGIVAAIVAVVALAAVVTYMMGIWGGRTVPDVTGMTENDAREILQESGFTVRSTQVKSDDTEGLVLIMDPAAGTRTAESSEIIIHVASARLIPDIVGMTKEDAAVQLADAGYDNIRYEKVKSEKDENIVLSVEPEVGSRAKSNTEIVVNVSEPFKVPDISGMTWDEAFAAITDAGLVGQVVYINTEYYPEGSIIGTTPEAGTIVPEGSYVSVNIAQARGTLLTSLTQNLLVPGSTVNVGGYNYTIDALNSVTYMGNDTVAFSITGRPYVSLLGEVIHASSQTVNGQVVWSPSNQVVSIS